MAGVSEPSLDIKTDYKLKNSGAADLTFIDVRLPARPGFDKADLRAQIDKNQIAPERLSAEPEDPQDVRIGFDSLWRMGEQRELSLQYSLHAENQSSERTGIGTDDFHLGARGSFLVLEPPKHILASVPKRPHKMEYSVSVPMDFRVLARGRPEGTKQQGSQTRHLFGLGADDLGIFVVAGRYKETISTGPSKVVFWSFAPLTVDPAAAAHIGEVWSAMEKQFGVLDRNLAAPYLVEVPDLPAHLGEPSDLRAAAFPGGALVSSQALAAGTGRPEFIAAVSHALAHDWLGEQIFAASSASLVLGEGLPEYAMLVLDREQRGDAARHKRIAAYLLSYDKAATVAQEQTLAVASIDDPAPVRRIALAKAALFFAALEDQCGATQMQGAVKDLITLMRGQEVNYPELRSELEHASGRNLAPMFRLWLNEKGIPADFRARYATP